MIAPTQIKKPENWQDFEKLCKKLWGEIWDCSDTIQRNGRSGQNQMGVDVYGLPKGETYYYGIQCKGKDDYANSQLKKEEIDGEIVKAINFVPKLKRLIFATTANKDASIEEYIRLKNTENIQNGLFEVYISSWEDIVDLLEERRDTYNWYINNCQYKDSSDIDISFNGEKKVYIHPQYIRMTKIYRLKTKTQMLDDWKKWGIDEKTWISVMEAKNKQDKMFQKGIPQLAKEFQNIMYPSIKVDKRWCTVKIRIGNVGNTVISGYKLCLFFDGNSIEALDDKFRYENNFALSDAAKAQINAGLESRREVFESSEYSNEIIFKPKDDSLVQTDYKLFEIGIKPKDDISKIPVWWEFKSKNFRKEGELLCLIEPKYEDQEETIEVENEEELRENEITIVPKIIEE